jgi:RNA polymerase sigma-70 factor (ECF subfamily)
MRDQASSVLERFRQGDPQAFEALFHLHQRAVYAWTLRLVRNPATAEELTVESFFRIHRAHARFDPAQGFEGWARRIATRAALDWLRAHRPEDEPAPYGLEAPAPPIADPAITAEIRARTAEAFLRLPPKLRIAATLAVVEELPHKEVAAALGITVAAAKVRVFRALRRLRKDLEKRGITP